MSAIYLPGTVNTFFQNMEGINSNPRKRRMSPMQTANSKQVSDMPNPRLDDKESSLDNEHEPPQKKRKINLTPIIEESTTLDENPLDLHPFGPFPTPDQLEMH